MTDALEIPLDEIEFTYARSGGPGGQNVNKVNSKAILRWPVSVSPSLPDDVRERFLKKYRTRITTDGDLVVSSQKYRDQARNVEDCLAKLREMVASVAKPPVKRKATKPSKAAQKRRVEGKREVAAKKQTRRRPSLDAD